MCAVARYQDTFSARCFAYFLQSGNHAHALTLYCRIADDDLKTPTNRKALPQPLLF